MSGIVALSRGNFYNKVGLVLPANGSTTLEGQGWDDVVGSVLHYHASGHGISTNGTNRNHVRKLALLAAGSVAQVGPGTPLSMLKVDRSMDCIIEQVYIDGRNAAYGNNAAIGLLVEGISDGPNVGGSYYCTYRHLRITRNAIGVHLRTVDQTGAVQAWSNHKCASHTIESCVIFANTNIGVRTDGVSMLLLRMGEISGNTTFQLSLEELEIITYDGVWLALSGGGPVFDTTIATPPTENWLGPPQANVSQRYKAIGWRDGQMYINDAANANDPAGVNSLRVGGQVVKRRYTAAVAYSRTKVDDAGCGFQWLDADDNIIMQADEDAAVADGETALLVRRNVSGSYSLQAVSMGAADSGGSGFKLLRVPN